MTTLRVIVTDVNDNAPVFSKPSYVTCVLAKDVKKGGLVLTVSATDQDAENNSLIAYRSAWKCMYNAVSICHIIDRVKLES